MRAEIKNRIEQIRQGKVPAGYKKAGGEIFPGDWTTASIETLYTERKESGQEGLPVLSVSIHSGVSDKSLDKTERGKEIKRIEDKTQYKKVYPGDLIFNMMRAWQGGIGVASVQGQVSPAYIVAQPNDSIFPYYMNYYMKMPQMIGKLQRRSYGVTDFRLRLYWKSFVTIMCHLPDLREQKCIAAILETQDRVIALREKLLAEKLRQKQYLMQVLLTGKTRLCGSTQIWQYQALKDISCEITKKAGNEKYEVLSISAGIGFVNQAKKFGKLIAGKQYKNYIVISHGDFSYNKGNSKKYPQGCVYPLENQDEAAVPNVFISFRLDKNICFWKFYKYVFENGWLNKQLRRLISSGARGDGLLNLSDEDFYSCIVPVPPLNEQVKIADILSSADQEIDLLKQELEQERRKKKALMQLLLSGIVRVKP